MRPRRESAQSGPALQNRGIGKGAGRAGQKLGEAGSVQCPGGKAGALLERVVTASVAERQQDKGSKGPTGFGNVEISGIHRVHLVE